MKYGGISYGFEVFDGDDLYASGEGPDLDECHLEANRYLWVLCGSSEAPEARVVLYERREILEP